jgi:hypothetical protein
MEVPYNPSLERQVTRDGVHRPPFPLLPPHQGRLGRDPHPPPQDIPLPQVNYPSVTSLGEILTLASKSGSEDAILTQDDHEEYFWLNGTSIRGQTAEIETSAGLYSASLWQIRKSRPGRYNQDKSMAGRYTLEFI